MDDKDDRKLFPGSFSSSRKQFSQNYRLKDSESIEISQLFHKKFDFTNSNATWCLPSPEVMFKTNVWMVEELQAVKKELNAVKSKLNDIDIEDWHKHTKTMSKSGDILWKLRNEYDPEFVTQAWCKFYENLMTFPMIPKKVVESQRLNSVHLCEAPGAFITSLNHFLKLHYSGIEWHWRATTLNPYYEGNALSSMINDDRFIFQTLPNWTFGSDYSGNIMNLDNINHIVEEVKQIGEIHLVTADGSVDCQDNPAEQESEVSFLQYCEVVTALSILEEGGSFLLKIFTTYEAPTASLLYLLCCAFDQVTLFKPVTSKEGNSEVYVVCLKYKGRKHLDPWLENIKKFIETQQKENVMFPLECFPQDFIEQLLSCSTMFKNFQIEAIESNIQSYGETSNNYKTKRLKYLITQHFMKHYRLERLFDESKEVVGKKKLKETMCLNLDGYIRKGSFSNMMQEKTVFEDKLLALHEELQEWNPKWSADCDIKWLQLLSSQPEFKVISGKSVSVVHCSKFCSRHILQILGNVREVTDHLLGSDCGSKCLLKELPSRYISESPSNFFGETIGSNLKVLSIKADYWCSLNHNANEMTEKAAFNEILDTLNEMEEGENLFLTGYPLLTQFNVGVVYVLTSLFQKVGLINPSKHDYGIIFVGFQVKSEKTLRTLRFFTRVKEMSDEYKNTNIGKSVLAILSITELCGKQDLPNTSFEPSKKYLKLENEIEEIENTLTFCRCVIEMNNVYINDKISSLISSLLPTR